MQKTNWINANTIQSYSFKCGHCGHHVASEKGYTGDDMSPNPQQKRYVRIYICHNCYCPTFFDYNLKQTPGPSIGNKVANISDQDVEKLFDEARACFSISAFTSCVMCCRKLLMSIAVSEGAKEGGSFVDYVNYLDTNNYIPPNGKKWVDSIRKLGNEANHKIEFRTQSEATRILNFAEMLLRFIYELPGIMNNEE